MQESELILERKVDEAIERYAMLPPGSAVIVGLSGGADSMTLISVLYEKKDELGLQITAAHVNHGIRGAEADRDEEFCRSWCIEHDIPIIVLHADVPTEARKTGESEETCGRRIRYAFFEKAASHPEAHDALIATAHTASDSIETMLFHLVRGTGISGLTGIPPVRDKIIRPLILCIREDIEDYCRRKDIPYIHDSTNDDSAYARNRIRNEIIPQFCRINASAPENIIRCMELLQDDSEYLDSQAERLVREADIGSGKYLAGCLKDAPSPIRSRALYMILASRGGAMPEFRHVQLLTDLLHDEGSFKIPGGICVRVKNGTLDFPEKKTDASPEKEWSVSAAKEGMINTPEGVAYIEKTAQFLENMPDYDKICFPMIIRNRRPGDRFRPPHRGISKPFKQVFQEAGIEADARSHVILIESGGEIIWAEGIGPADGFAADRDSVNILKIDIRRNLTHVQ